VGATVLQFNPLIDRTMAASLGSGNITSLELGVRLFFVPAALLGAILISPLSATWAAALDREGWEPVGRSFSQVVRVVVIFVPPLAIAGFLVRHDLVSLIYSSHAYTPLAVSRTADVLGVLLFGLVPEILFVPLSALFVIHGDTVFPMKVALANFTLNTVLDIALRGPLGVTGIALSTTLTYFVLLAAYFWEAERRWKPLYLRSAARPLAVSAVSGSVLFVSCAMVYGLSHQGHSRGAQLAVVAVVVALAGLIHSGLALLSGLADEVGIPTRRRASHSAASGVDLEAVVTATDIHLVER
jgi:peptidoglycan biosynthesis protein MviN/MurJ (putative lipid II flippase)